MSVREKAIATMKRMMQTLMDMGFTFKVEGIEFPESSKAVNEYPIATLAKAPNPDAAAAFVAYVLSPEGQQVLSAGGFAAP